MTTRQKKNEDSFTNIVSFIAPKTAKEWLMEYITEAACELTEFHTHSHIRTVVIDAEEADMYEIQAKELDIIGQASLVLCVDDAIRRIRKEEGN